MPWILRKTSFRGAATVQLSTLDSSLVVHLVRKNGHSSTACVPLLESVFRDENIVKVGCGVDDDMLTLRSKWPGLEARSRLDLSKMLSPDGGSTLGLKRLCHNVLGIELPKSRRISTSDWSQVPLFPAQLTYSARDAWAGAAIANELARCYPHVFDHAALIETLRSERSLWHLEMRAKRRKEAKLLIKTILAPYSDRTRKVPSWKLSLVRGLRGVINDNRPYASSPLPNGKALAINGDRIEPDMRGNEN